MARAVAEPGAAVPGRGSARVAAGRSPSGCSTGLLKRPAQPRRREPDRALPSLRAGGRSLAAPAPDTSRRPINQPAAVVRLRFRLTAAQRYRLTGAGVRPSTSAAAAACRDATRFAGSDPRRGLRRRFLAAASVGCRARL